MENEKKGADKRRFKRYDVRDVEGTLAFATSAAVVNLSLDGMAIETPSRLNVGRRYSVRLRHANRLVSMEGRVVWCSLARFERQPRGDSKPVYKAGLEFEGVLSEKARELKGFLEGNVMLDLEKRIFGRFTLESSTPADVSGRYEFLVRRISLSGMLIETELAAEKDAHFSMEVALDGTPLTLEGRVANSEPANNGDGAGEEVPSRSLLGVEFAPLGAEQTHLLEAFIRDHLEQEG